MRKLIIIVAFIALSFLTTAPVLAAGMEMCNHEPDIASLRNCVQHASHEGHITNQGIVNSLLSKLDAAQAALTRGEKATATNLLNAFINEVQAQAGKHINVEQPGIW